MKFFTKNKKPKSSSRIKGNLASPEILEVNLIKDEASNFLNWRKFFAPLFLSVLVAAILVAEVYFLIGWWEKQESERSLVVDSNYQVVLADIKELQTDYQKLTDFKNKVDLMKNLINHHPYWTNFFNWLESRTLSSITLDGFSGDLKGQYSFGARTNTFADISWQVRALLDDEHVLKASVDSGSGGIITSEDEDGNIDLSSEVSFSIELEIDPKIFYLD